MCTSLPPPPLPTSFIPLQWWWSSTLQDNVLTTDAHPPQDSTYEYVGVAGFALTSFSPQACELALYRALG